MNTLHLTDEQLFLVEHALEFYTRIGIGQFDKIKDHPTFEKHLYSEFALKQGPLEVGDKTVRGEVVEIDPDGKWVKTRGRWSGDEEIKKWDDPENIQHSTDYKKFHNVRDAVDNALVQPRNMLYNDHSLGRHGSWGIHHKNVDDSCRMAFDIQQVIRHERWKQIPNRNNSTVDSYIHFTYRKDNSSLDIKCELENKNKTLIDIL